MPQQDNPQHQGSLPHVQVAMAVLYFVGLIFMAVGKCDTESKYSSQQKQIDEIKAVQAERLSHGR